MLAKYHPLWLNIHVNHSNEITDELEQACDRLIEQGFAWKPVRAPGWHKRQRPHPTPTCTGPGPHPCTSLLSLSM